MINKNTINCIINTIVCKKKKKKTQKCPVIAT